METFINLFVGIGITIHLTSFFAKNIITARQTGKPIRGKSWKVKASIIIISILYSLSYFCIFFEPNILFDIELLDILFIKILGLVFIAIALIIGVSTLITMKTSWRMGIVEEQQTDLILNGFFKYSRNPYFLSYLLIFFGIFLVFPSVLYLIIYIPSVIIIHIMILDEEKYLALQHGNSYLEYKKSVSRYISVRARK